MAKLTKWEKTELLSLYKRERMDKRCIIVQDLTKRKNELTSDITKDIDAVKAQLQELETELSKVLEKHKLTNFEGSSTYSCRISTLHESLISFDAETITEIQKIIRDS